MESQSVLILANGCPPTRQEERPSLSQSKTMASTPTSKTAEDIRDIMTELDFDAVERHFNGGQDEVAPLVVCEGVSVRAFNKYIGDDEGLPIALRFLHLDNDGRLAIVDRSTPVHESTKCGFACTFLLASGNPVVIGERGSFTARRPGQPKKAADATYGPMRSTLNRTPPPAHRCIGDWVTLAVEVGNHQTWAGLEDAARWWCCYDGIQYVLLLKVSDTGTEMRYALYDITALGTLPAPIASGTFERNSTGQPAATITFDMRRILSIPANRALPADVNPTAVVDLRAFMDRIIDNL